jgi:hypothetical protein
MKRKPDYKHSPDKKKRGMKEFFPVFLLLFGYANFMATYSRKNSPNHRSIKQ